MIITEYFVMLNLPKTGSSFARKCIKDIYKQRFQKLPLHEKIAIWTKLKSPLCSDYWVENIKVKSKVGNNGIVDQHGTYEQIPRKHSHKKIISIVRDPISAYISRYNWESWIRKPPCPKNIVQKHFPHYPNLNFSEYLKLIDLALPYYVGHETPNTKIGLLSIQFIRMFFKDPEEVITNISDKYIDSDQVFEDVADIEFLRQEKLNHDLKCFLSKYGFTNEELKTIDNQSKVNVSHKKRQASSNLITPR